jgi:IS30 family transposase
MADTSTKNKHMSLDDRIKIQECLSHAMTFKAIARQIGKDQTTVSKEVKKHLTIVPTVVNRLDANGESLPTPICPQLLKAPFVCNSCKRHSSRCAFDRHIYYARQAHKEYEQLLSEAREGIPLGKEEFYKMDGVISEAVKNGQHLYHLLKANTLAVSKSTVYRHLQKGYLSVGAIDFPRVVKFRPRKQKQTEYVPKQLKIGRTYEDFLAFVEDNEISQWTEMDTVIGRIGGKVILTLDFTLCNFMAGILLDNKTAFEAAAKFRKLKADFSENAVVFGDVIPLILTDNGGEFADVFSFELDLNNIKETSLFFCDPMQSSQKPHVEKNHTLFRDIVPKGQSFDGFTQETVNLIFSHVNSVKRKSLNGKTAYEMFCFTYSAEIAKIFGVKAIPALQVVQSPKLLRSAWESQK